MPFKVSQSELFLQDFMVIEFDNATLRQEQGLFKLNQLPNLPYEQDDNTWISVTLEMDLSLTQYQRNVYTLFDWLSDIGGLSGMLFSLFALFMAAWNYNQFDNYMVHRLFKMKKPDDQIDASTPYFLRSEYIKADFYPNLLDWLLSFFPEACSNKCKRSRRWNTQAKAREKLEKETNIVEILKSLRYFSAAMRILLPL